MCQKALGRQKDLRCFQSRDLDDYTYQTGAGRWSRNSLAFDFCVNKYDNSWPIRGTELEGQRKSSLRVRSFPSGVELSRSIARLYKACVLLSSVKSSPQICAHVATIDFR